MNIIGPDRVVFGVDDLAACIRFLTDFGLAPVGVDATGGVFEALDGTAIEVRAKADPRLPAPLPTSTMLRQQVYGVKAPADLDAIEAELARDQRVTRLADGSLEAADGDGFALRFQVTTRRTLSMPAEKINAPGAPAQRAPNELGVYAGMPARPRTLSHVVLFVPDQKRAARWYCDRLKFVITDVLEPAGPFLRPQGTDDHHTLFFIQTPEYMQGLEHLAFHMGGPTELMVGGTRLVKAGYQSFWGPGRHKFGSNWFWYFNSPLGTHFEYDADMDKHDDSWEPRVAAMSPQASQMFRFESKPRWTPGAAPQGVVEDEGTPE